MAKDKEPLTGKVEIREIVEDVTDMVPRMPMPVVSPPSQIIEDQTLVDLYQELLQQGRDDRRECDTYLTNFVEMVINDGDSTTASKEALVNLMKIKTDITDKMSKIAAEMTKLKLKEKYNENPKSIEAQQTNFIIGNTDRRALIELIEDAKKSNAEESKQKDAEHLVEEEKPARKKQTGPYTEKENDE